MHVYTCIATNLVKEKETTSHFSALILSPLLHAKLRMEWLALELSLASGLLFSHRLHLLLHLYRGWWHSLRSWTVAILAAFGPQPAERRRVIGLTLAGCHVLVGSGARVCWQLGLRPSCCNTNAITIFHKLRGLSMHSHLHGTVYVTEQAPQWYQMLSQGHWHTGRLSHSPSAVSGWLSVWQRWLPHKRYTFGRQFEVCWGSWYLREWVATCWVQKTQKFCYGRCQCQAPVATHWEKVFAFPFVDRGNDVEFKEGCMEFIPSKLLIHYTRSLILNHYFARTNSFYNSFIPSSVRLWNLLPEYSIHKVFFPIILIIKL